MRKEKLETTIDQSEYKWVVAFNNNGAKSVLVDTLDEAKEVITYAITEFGVSSEDVAIYMAKQVDLKITVTEEEDENYE